VSSASDHARTLFSAIVPDRRDLLELAVAQLGPEHFPDDRWRNMFAMFKWYYDYAGDVLTKRAVTDVISHPKMAMGDAGKVQLYQTTYESLEEQQTAEHEFRWSLEQLKDLYAQQATKIALLEAMQVLNSGIEGSKGQEIRGHVAARERVIAQLAEIDTRQTFQEAPDGDVRDEEDDILAEYETKKQISLSGGFSGVEFGIPKLDQVISGLQPGELDFVIGYSSSGKSSLCCQLAWQAAVRQGKNVVYVTTETLRGQIRRKLISRHSRLSKFGIQEGLNSLDLKNGTLTEDLEERMREVVHDFAHCEDYGKLRVMQASEAMTVTGMKVRLQAIQREFPIDLIVVDALYILKPDVRRSKEREELNEKIESAMILAKTFDNGNGVPLITPWQVSRAAKELADREKRYSMSAMAETAYAERYADVVISLLEPKETSRYTTLSCSVIKNRDGEQSSGFDIDVDYATSYFTDSGRTQQAANNALLGLGLNFGA
jgi:replicative DNA helicase